jgi:hypothetical protein
VGAALIACRVFTDSNIFVSIVVQGFPLKEFHYMKELSILQSLFPHKIRVLIPKHKTMKN